MATVATSRRLIEFFSTVLGAIVVALLFPTNEAVLLVLLTIAVAFYRLLRESR